MSDNKRSKLIRFVGYTIFFLLMIYVLSIGPVVATLQTPEGMPLEYIESLSAIYAPLLWAADRSDILDEILRCYIKACGSPFHNKTN
ncbi:hypothetical protein V202x_13290 [Gimesia aquarii]|uniref:Uncharacterized protein n=1 Tax=Gimesia aquarii TaxID=2527964 RepID=A0A517WRS0_9PLAN|nr:hypothetical protein V202x_13290 [Gimesia aquarii]